LLTCRPLERVYDAFANITNGSVDPGILRRLMQETAADLSIKDFATIERGVVPGVGFATDAAGWDSGLPTVVASAPREHRETQAEVRYIQIANAAQTPRADGQPRRFLLVSQEAETGAEGHCVGLLCDATSGPILCGSSLGSRGELLFTPAIWAAVGFRPGFLVYAQEVWFSSSSGGRRKRGKQNRCGGQKRRRRKAKPPHNEARLQASE